MSRALHKGLYRPAGSFLRGAAVPRTYSPFPHEGSHPFRLHNGKQWVPLRVGSTQMLQPLGMWVPTRTYRPPLQRWVKKVVR